MRTAVAAAGTAIAALASGMPKLPLQWTALRNSVTKLCETCKLSMMRSGGGRGGDGVCGTQGNIQHWGTHSGLADQLLRVSR